MKILTYLILAIFLNLNILKLKIYKFKVNTLCSCFSNYFRSPCEVNVSITRYAVKDYYAVVHFKNSVFYVLFITYIGCKLWHGLQSEIKQNYTQSCQTFINKIRHFLYLVRKCKNTSNILFFCCYDFMCE